MTWLCLLLTFAIGETDAEAKALLKKAADRYQNQPFNATLEGKMTVKQMGMTIELQGNVIRKDETHQKVDMTMTMPQGSMKSKVTMDGTMTWTEVDMMGMKQVIKGTIEETKAMGGQSSQMSFDDVMENLDDFADWNSVEKEGDMITMRGTMKAESAQGLDTKDIMFKFHKGDFFPYTVVFGDEANPVMHMSLKDPKPLTAEQKSDNFYTYTPPEGVMVMDIKDMPKGM